MKILNDLAGLKRQRRAVVLAAGFFDGLHRGHHRVIERCLAAAERVDGKAFALTFDTHPLKVLNPTVAPPLLTSTPHKLRLLARMGLHGCVVLPFSRELAALEPEAFIGQIKACTPPLVEVVTGGNWHFGRQGRGDPALLARMTRELHLKVTVVRPVIRRGETISSTRIRAAIMRGSLAEASQLLGRPFSILGTVVEGRTIGRRLGFPTANLDPHNEVLPPFGVYAVRAVPDRGASPCGGRPSDGRLTLHDGVLNVGVRPTFRDTADANPAIELHLLDIAGDLYGRDIEVFFVEWLREERRFASAAQLKAQIARDISSARAALASRVSSKKRKDSLYSQWSGVL